MTPAVARRIVHVAIGRWPAGWRVCWVVDMPRSIHAENSTTAELLMGRPNAAVQDVRSHSRTIVRVAVYPVGSASLIEPIKIPRIAVDWLIGTCRSRTELGVPLRVLLHVT